jgi:hypothetical protein
MMRPGRVQAYLHTPPFGSRQFRHDDRVTPKLAVDGSGLGVDGHCSHRIDSRTLHLERELTNREYRYD